MMEIAKMLLHWGMHNGPSAVLVRDDTTVPIYLGTIHLIVPLEN